MIEQFIEKYAKKLANYPEMISVEKKDCADGVEIILFSSPEDMGKFIGKNGKMIHSLKSFLSGCRVKNNIHHKIIVQSR